MRRAFVLLVVFVLAMSLKPSAIPPKDMDLRQWSAYAKAQQAVPHIDIQSFTPTAFVGFSANPSGPLYYVNLGALAVIFTNGPWLGTSNAITFELSGVPEEIRPTDERYVMVSGYNGGIFVPTQAFVRANGDIAFWNAQVTTVLGGTDDIRFTTAWINPGTKGLPGGAFIIYPK